MDDRTRGLLRDGTLALVALAGLGDLLRRRGETRALRSVPAALLGVVGAVAIEAVMLRSPERTRSLWERPAVQGASVLGALGVGRLLAARDGGFSAAACCWGLVTDLGLLVVVLTGRANPVGVLAGCRVNE